MLLKTFLYKTRESVAQKHLQKGGKKLAYVVAKLHQQLDQTLCYFFFFLFEIQLSAEYRCDSQERFFQNYEIGIKDLCIETCFLEQVTLLTFKRAEAAPTS